MKSPRFILVLVLLFVFVIGLAWQFWPQESAAPAPAIPAMPPSTPKIAAAVAQPVKPTAVEAPKLPPAAPGGAPVTLNYSSTPTAIVGLDEATPARAKPQANLVPYIEVNQANPDDTHAAKIELMKQQLQIDRDTSQKILDAATARANGDPAQLAKIETARQQYETYLDQKQKSIDDLEAQGGQ